MENRNFWISLDDLLNSTNIKIDRTKGSVHPKYTDYIYPHDYGYIVGTNSTDGAEIDCWVGSKAASNRGSEIDSKHVDGVIVTIDSTKHDSEIKILINCTESDMKEILERHQRGSMKGLLIKRENNLD